MRTVDFTGTVSQATMRAQDVLPALMSVLAEFAPDVHYKIRSEFIEIAGVSYLVLHDDDPAWQSEGIMWLMETISDAMDDLSPHGYYFGAHVGDGSDYGYWPLDHLYDGV